MKSKPEVSDQEIRNYMDFDGLLAKQKQRPSPFSRNIGWWGLLMITVGSISFWWFTQEEVVKTEDIVAVTEEITDDKSHTDQSAAVEPVTENTITPPRPEEKEVDRNAEKTRKQSPVTIESHDEVKTETTVPTPQESVYLQAEPAQGYAHLYQYFSAELVYPPAAMKDSVQGVLTVSFTVNVEGKPERINVTQSLGELFDREAIRLIQNMPAWKPAMLNNKPVPSKIALPLTFQIKKVKAQE